jgi:alcohol dehydrogenase (NADP+)
MDTQAYAVRSPTDIFAPLTIQRRALGPQDVLIQILFCGVCHSDLHQARGQWGDEIYPMVPGHEIVGRVIQLGDSVDRFKIDDLVGVGCFVDSCRQCVSCQADEEQFCEKHLSLTYNSTEQDQKTPTYGGYSSHIVVDQNYVLKIPQGMDPARCAPLLCAGITTYSPIKRYGIAQGCRAGVVGFGGLGHMAVKFLAHSGVDVTVFSTSDAKEQDALKFGAKLFINTRQSWVLDSLANSYDFILDTVSAAHDVNVFLRLLKRSGTMVLVGIASEPLALSVGDLVKNRRVLAGSLIGGIAETQEMLNYCAQNHIYPEVEIINIQQIDWAYERMTQGKVHYRFVIDLSSL